MRLAGTQKVIAIAAMSDGSFWSGEINIVVTAAACLDEALGMSTGLARLRLPDNAKARRCRSKCASSSSTTWKPASAATCKVAQCR